MLKAQLKKTIAGFNRTFMELKYSWDTFEESTDTF